MSAGTVYLLHFDSPLEHASHYVGWTKDDDPIDRINAHLRGKDTGRAILTAICRKAGLL